MAMKLRTRVDTAELNKQIELIGKTISKYPEDKKELIAQTARAYIQYNEELFNDLRDSFARAVAFENYGLSYSNKTQELEDKLAKQGFEEMSKLQKAFVKETWDTLCVGLKKINDPREIKNQLETLLTTVELGKAKVVVEANYVYSQIFE